jgi:hypothetical protein
MAKVGGNGEKEIKGRDGAIFFSPFSGRWKVWEASQTVG